LFGTVTSEVARPWLAEMHIGIDAIEASLRHELVHVMAAEFGPHYIGVPFLRVLGLTEGLAMAVLPLPAPDARSTGNLAPRGDCFAGQMARSNCDDCQTAAGLKVALSVRAGGCQG